VRPLERVLLFALGACVAFDTSAAAPTVELFSPQGTIKNVRQVTVRFSAPMVALGDPRLADPFTADCQARGHGRWVDERNWVYDFDADLGAGIICRFTPEPKLAARDGTPLRDLHEYRFDTGGPTIRASLPRQGATDIDADQVFVLALDGPVSTQSIERFAYCTVNGLGERIPVQLLVDKQRDAVLAQRRDLGYSYYSLLWKNGIQTAARVRDRALERDEQQLIVLNCARRLPPDTDVQLVWGAGITSAGGIATATDQLLPFRTRAAFTAALQCSRVNARAGCIPTAPIQLRFSAPVPFASAMLVALVAADGTRIAPDPIAGAPATVEELNFSPPFADGQVMRIDVPASLADDIGRRLANADRFPLDIPIDEYPPLAKFSGDFGILESASAVLPVTLRNVEPRVQSQRTDLRGQRLRIAGGAAAVAAWLRRVEAANAPRGEWVKDAAQHSVWKEQTGTASVFAPGEPTEAVLVPYGGAGSSRQTEVVGIPLGGPGFYVVELASPKLGAALLGRDQTRYVVTAALVTNLAVHFKWGRESSRIWVTRLDDAAPVVGAQVAIDDYCDGTSRWRGRTGADGVAIVDETLGAPQSSASCTYTQKPLMISAQTSDDFGFVVSSWDQGIRPWDFALPVGNEWGAALYHSVLDRPLYRAGETVSMKHFLRRHVDAGVALANDLPGKRGLRIWHQDSGAYVEFDADFDDDGVAQSRWTIPADAKLGTYSVEIDDAGTWRESASFRVEEFRLPSIRATVQGPGRPLLNPSEVRLDLHAAYLSGGGASGLPVKLRTAIEARPVQFAAYKDFQFGGDEVVEGVTQRNGGAYDFDPEQEAQNETIKARVLPLQLDAQGAARVTVPDIPALQGPSVLTAEMDYADANGEVLTTAGRVMLWPTAINLGIRREGWVASTEQLRFRVVALDLDGKPAANQRVAVTLYRATDYSYRKRLIGGFYAYETMREIKRLEQTCSGVTDAHGLLTCEVAPGVAGEVILVAATKDADGNPARASTSVWVVGADDWWFGGTTGDRMDVLPEQQEYQPGEKARFQVRMPFRSATALVTIEREGVIDSFVTRLDGSDPVIEVPITAAYSPNVFVSVLAVRGRVGGFSSWLADVARRFDLPGWLSRDGGQPTARVDLSRPAYRLGIAQIRVGWQPHRLDVTVKPAQTTFQVRDNARVTIHVARADGAPLPAGAEVALAAVDDALLELAPNRSWDLLAAMMGQRGIEVWTSTAQLQVVGKRHYGRKAVTHGGGGGRERARELFDTLLSWQGRVPLDANGDAEVSIPLNDSLTSFRIVAVANAGPDLFGTGNATITTTQELQLRSGLPPVVREGDRYAATFTLRNTGDRPVAVNVDATTTPALPSRLPTQSIELAAGAARDVSWDVTVPVNETSLAWDATVRAKSGTAQDRVKVTQRVIAAVPVRTYQATLAQLDPDLSLTAERPHDAIVGRGGLDVNLRARLGDGLVGVQEYMSRYSYVCLEQSLSRAVALRDPAMWSEWMARLSTYRDRDGLLKYFASNWLDGDDTLTAYVLAIANASGYPIPQDEQQPLLNALTAFVEGRIVRGSALPTADLTIRKLAAIEALSRYDAATPRQLDSITIDPDSWPTSAVIDWLNVLYRLPTVTNRDQRIVKAESVIRARLNFQGTTMGFATERSDALWWLMVSTDSNAARALLTLLDRPAWRTDLPRMARGLMGRQQLGRWNTTVANAWGVLAMEKFSKLFEATPVTGSTAISYGALDGSLVWSKDAGEQHEELPWTDGARSLQLVHHGDGKPWALVRAQAALPLRQPLRAGFSIERSVTPVEQHDAGVLDRGDVVRIHLAVTADSDMTWVVVDDPIPAGATIIGGTLGGQSDLLTRDDKQGGAAWLAFQQRAFDSLRSYYRFVPKGEFSIDYTIRLNNSGVFQLPPTRVEAMYAPEMFGESPNAAVTVEPSP